MSTINDRIKMLRKHLKLSQAEFGRRIGISQQQTANIEHSCGVNTSNIKLICNEFGVSEDWLRNGEGEMFDVASDSPKGSALEQLAKEYNLSDSERSYIKLFVNKSPTDRESFLNALQNVMHFQMVTALR